MQSTDDTPSKNDAPRNIPYEDKWTALKRATGNIVDRYVIVLEKDQLSEQTMNTLSETNPHEARIQVNILMRHPVKCIHREFKQKTIILTLILLLQRKDVYPTKISNQTAPTMSTRQTAPDSVFEYVVLNDGLIFLEFRDAVHEGDGEEII